MVFMSNTMYTWIMLPGGFELSVETSGTVVPTWSPPADR